VQTDRAHVRLCVGKTMKERFNHGTTEQVDKNYFKAKCNFKLFE
jgi:hypothetical protein